MNTAIAITAIIAGLLLANSIVTAIRDVAQAKHKAATCEQCGHNTSKETEA
ncbi:hypothetical protein [Streptomyces sp. NPDC086182]|uniref:hypothetical protein n=1 Tax=Streptomyces sp. NPDC086182 TaxID=3155058 RepID=UPI0034149E4B